jgi:menaquinone-specific isochorismate synthase
MRTFVMETIPTGPLERDRARFMQLLASVRESAREDGHWKIVSVSLAAARHIDPLAVLESIYEPDERHFYMERAETGESLAGAECAWVATFAGPTRFARARDFARELFDNTVAVGQLELPLAGPKLFAAFTFEDVAAPDAVFAPATLFVPRWQVSSAEGAYVATANILVEPDGDLEAQAERVLEAHRKFTSFNYARQAHEAPFCARATAVDSDGKARYCEGVQEALRNIGEGVCAKVVLARRQLVESPEPLHPLHTLARLRDRFPSCCAFSFSDTHGTSFIGASPERLVRVADGVVQTEAVAGTTTRGASPARDAELASALMGNDKQMREHRAVAETIAGQLCALGLEAGPMPRARLLRLPNAQHIRTPFSAPLRKGLHLFDIAAALHPTPATAGLPREEALALIDRIEGEPRGLFAGLVGWCDAFGAGELIVCLRSGLIRGCEASLFAGAGIVAGSVAEDEAAETGVKMSALADLLG